MIRIYLSEGVRMCDGRLWRCLIKTMNFLGEIILDDLLRIYLLSTGNRKTANELVAQYQYYIFIT